MLLITPVTVASGISIRSTMTQDRVIGPTVFSIENEVSYQLDYSKTK